jgi:outer membrane lipoprotein-sorting protein
MSMKMHESVLVTSLVALLVVPTVGCGGAAETAVAATATVAAAPAMTDAEVRALIAKAADVSTKFTSYHGSATVTSGNSAKIEADLLEDAIDAIVNRPDGTIWHHVGVGEESVVSTDGDATWRPDEVQGSSTASEFIAGPVNALQTVLAHPKLELSVVGLATVDNVETTHLSLKGPHAPMVEVWIAKHAELGPHVKRMRCTLAATQGKAHVDVTYSKYNEPVEIRLPGVS